MGAIRSGMVDCALLAHLPVRIERPIRLHNRRAVQGDRPSCTLCSIGSWNAERLQLRILWYRSWCQLCT